MVDVGGQDKPVFVFDEVKQVCVGILRRILVAVDVDHAAPVCPVLFGRIAHHLKSAGVHIVKAVLFGKVGKVFVEPFAGIGEARRGGQSRARSDQNGVGVLKLLF